MAVVLAPKTLLPGVTLLDDWPKNIWLLFGGVLALVVVEKMFSCLVPKMLIGEPKTLPCDVADVFCCCVGDPNIFCVVGAPNMLFCLGVEKALLLCVVVVDVGKNDC